MAIPLLPAIAPNVVIPPQQYQTRQADYPVALGPWVNYGYAQRSAYNPVDSWIMEQSMNLLGQIQELPADRAYMEHMGLNPPLRSGVEALNLIRQRNIQVVFGDMGDTTAHAQWLADQNMIMINQKYRYDARMETLYAISEAIFHEAGHAAGNGDNQSSIQEELNCLALNTLAHRYHRFSDPQYDYKITHNNSPLIANGVALYGKLFFDPDPYKQALVNRVVEKYGELPMTSPGHEAPPPSSRPLGLVYRVAEEVDKQNVAKGPHAAFPALAQAALGTRSVEQTVTPTPPRISYNA